MQNKYILCSNPKTLNQIYIIIIGSFLSIIRINYLKIKMSKAKNCTLREFTPEEKTKWLDRQREMNFKLGFNATMALLGGSIPCPDCAVAYGAIKSGYGMQVTIWTNEWSPKES